MTRSPQETGVRHVRLAGPAETEALANAIAETLRVGDVIALTGDLGAGKTVFARALIRTLAAAADVELSEVPSPTFTLVQLYDFPSFTVYHFDLYRLSGPDEAFELGIEDAFADGVSVIEWAERIEDLLPAHALRIRLEFGDAEDVRIAHISTPDRSVR